jgi:hypothetical protein
MARRWLGWRWWAQALSIWAVSRVWSTIILVATYHDSGGRVDLSDLVIHLGGSWDSAWYRGIAEDGYPDDLPRNPDGSVPQNNWNFYPMLPYVGRYLMRLTGLSWNTVTVAVVVVCGMVAVCLIDRVMQAGADRWLDRSRSMALWTVTLMCFYPSSPLFQVSYTEVPALMGIAAFLLAVIHRRYELAILIVIPVGVTRAVVLPLAAVVGFHALDRFWTARRQAAADGVRLTSVFRPVDMARVALLAVASTVAGFEWAILVGIATGVPDGLLLSQQAWRTTGPIDPVHTWLRYSEDILGPWAGPILLVVIIAGIVALAAWPGGRVLGPEVRAFAWIYPMYLIGASFPNTSIIRFMMVDFPLGAVTVRLVRSRAGLIAVLGLFAIAQLVWTVWLWETPSTGIAGPP